MSEWKNFCLGDVCNTISETYRRKSERVTLINTSDVLNGKILNHDSVLNKNLKGQFKKTFQKDDILFSEIRPINRRCAFVDFENTQDYIASTKLMVLRANKEEILPRYLYFFLTAENVLQELQHLAETRSGTFPQITFDSELATFPINLPPLETQKKIAAMLSALDDKIELNNAISKNLEEQSQAIFKNMFPAVISNEVSIGEYITPKRGKSLLVKDTICGKFPVVAGGIEPATYHNESNTSAPVLTISASGANAGYVRLWNIPVWSSDSSFIDSSITEDVYFWYVMLKLRQQEIFDSQTGTAQPHVYPKHIAQLPIKELDEHRIKEFTKRVTPLFSMIGENIQQNKKLGEIRDALLSRLMSGEIDVSGVEI